MGGLYLHLLMNCLFKIVSKKQNIAQLNPTKDQAIEAYKTADAKGKKLLVSLWGKDTFVPQHTFPMSFEESCKRMKLNPKTVLPFPKPKNDREKVANAQMMLGIIAEAIQNGYKFKDNDPTEKRWFAIFDASGFGFSYAHFARTYAPSSVGSRLSFPRQDMAEHFGKQFNDLHKIVFTQSK